MTNYFTRELELNDCTLEIYQELEGDVGCVVWDAAIALAKYIEMEKAQAKYNFQGKAVIELGAGTGIVGLVAAVKGAKVIITDLEQFVPLMQMNVTQNASKLKDNRMQACALKWGDDLENFKDEYDFILMADLIYYNESLIPLVQTMVALSSKRTVILMSYEERSTGNKPQLQKEFFKLAEEYFIIHEVPTEEQDPVYNSDDIHIYEMKLKG